MFEEVVLVRLKMAPLNRNMVYVLTNVHTYMFPSVVSIRRCQSPTYTLTYIEVLLTGMYGLRVEICFFLTAC